MRKVREDELGSCSTPMAGHSPPQTKCTSLQAPVAGHAHGILAHVALAIPPPRYTIA